MKTIEERADAYVGHPFEIDEFSSTTAKRQAFIDGAKEQRKIDIDKACDWLSDYFIIKHEAMSAQGCDAFLKKFRSAMEEDL